MEILAHESREKRAVALALINSLGNCGTVAASFTWPTTVSIFPLSLDASFAEGLSNSRMRQTINLVSASLVELWPP